MSSLNDQEDDDFEIVEMTNPAADLLDEMLDRLDGLSLDGR